MTVASVRLCDNCMNGLFPVKSQQQDAGVWFVVRIFENNFCFCNDPRYCCRIDSALEHALKGVTGKVQGFTFHVYAV